jgi:hypothetical protein
VPATAGCRPVLSEVARVRRRRPRRSAWWAVVPVWLEVLFPGDVLVVPVAGGRTHEQPVAPDAPGGGWPATLPDA